MADGPGMKIGIVHYAAPPGTGGVELTIFHHSRVLTQLGHEITVVAGKGAPFLEGVHYHELPLTGSRNEEILEVGAALASGIVPPGFAALVAQIREGLTTALRGCDVAIGHNLFTLHKNLALTVAVHELVETQTGPPWIAWHHDFAWLRPQYVPELHAGYPWDLLRRAWPGVRHVTVSEAQRAALAGLYAISAEDITVVPPGVEPARFLRLPTPVVELIEQWHLLEADALFLLPARITRRKNLEVGMQWLAAIRRISGWDARLVITGPPGPHNPANQVYLQELLALRRQLDAEDAIHFVYEASGASEPRLLDDESVAALYMVADALLFPSRQEGFGIPLLEAGLARIPIFANELPPFRQSAGPHATLFPDGTSHDDVARAVISELEQDRAFRLRRRILRDFTWRGLVEERMLPLLRRRIHAHQ